jgi:hypothetical protein
MRVNGLGAAVTLTLLLMLVGGTSSRAADEPCASRSSSSGFCTGGKITGGGVDLSGHDDRSQIPSGSGARGAASPAVPGDDAPAPAPNPLPWDYFDHCDAREPVCQTQFFHATPATLPSTAPVPGVTLEDVAQFVPRSASVRSQPNGWALVGAPVNLLTDATAQVVDGQLLGRPAQVRFVPVSFVWDYGDGTSTTVQGPGASWRELGQPDFSATDTSHVYPTMGDRSVTLSISYSPSYRFDGGAWQQIPGTLPVQVGPVMIHVLEGSTVLVSGACGTRDAGPGC